MNTSEDMTDYSLRIARRHVEIYKDLMDRHREAMECRACEDFLEAGLEAYKWLRQSDTILREAARQGFDVPPDAVEALRVLFEAWLRQCRNAFSRIRFQEKKGFSVANSRDFREAYDNVRKHLRMQKDYAALDEVLRGDVFDSDFWGDAARIRSEHAN